MLVWTYGTLKKGQHNARFLESATYKGNVTLTFKAKCFDVGFPVLMKSRSKITVEGELYEVDAETFAQLDRLEGQGRMYKRRRKRLDSGFHAWVYFGIGRFWQARAYGRPVSPDDDGITRWRAR